DRATPGGRRRRPDAVRPALAGAVPPRHHRRPVKVPDTLAKLVTSRSTFYAWKAAGKAPRCHKLPNGELCVERADFDAWFAGDMKWPGVAPNSRRSNAETLATVTPALLSGFPTCAVAEACHQNGTTFAQWESLLWPAGVDLVPLDGSDVFDTAPMAGALAVRHTVVVAQQVRGVIVTRAPWQYPSGAVPLRVL